jgi:ParB family chromosome partitioning protein
MSEKRRLGRGLGALIPEVMAGTGETNEIALERIKANPYQPRREFDDEKLQELAASIKRHGIIQAIVLTPAGEEGEYLLVAGERRCRAAKIAGLSAVPAIIKSYDSKAMLEIALIENLQRENLNPVDEAKAYQRLMKEFSYTQEELAGRLGRSRPSVANSIRLLSLPESVLGALVEGRITAGQARPLLSLDDPLLQEEAANKIINDGMSAREAENMAVTLSGKDKNGKSKEKSLPEDPLHVELQLQIQRTLGTKVRIRQGKSGGTIEIYYYGDEDLERLIAKLLPEGI